jgi:hypothetical protein
LNQTDAVFEAMIRMEGYSTLGDLYRIALRIPNCEWKAKDPYANIRRIVQTSSKFFRIKPGLWGLTSKKDSILDELGLKNPRSDNHKYEEKFTHSYYQGLLGQVGALRGFATFIPKQDKNKRFLKKKLSDVSTLESLYPFTYDNLINKANTVDVIWFNDRKLPDSFFEIEHSTNITNSLMKYLEFRDFRINFWIVADRVRETDYKNKINQYVFRPILNNTNFLDYDSLSKIHSKEQELKLLKERSGMN